MPSIDENKDILLGLLITEYTSVEREFVTKICNQVESVSKIPALSIGNMKSVSQSTLEMKWFTRLDKVNK